MSKSAQSSNQLGRVFPAIKRLKMKSDHDVILTYGRLN